MSLLHEADVELAVLILVTANPTKVDVDIPRRSLIC